MGAMAQKNVVSNVQLTGNEALVAHKAVANAGVKTANTFYPEAFQSCADLESPAIYTFEYGDYTLPVTGSGMFDGVAMVYSLSSPVTVVGVEAYATNAYEGDEATPDIVLMTSDFSSELANTTYSTTDLPVSSQSLVFGPIQANFPTPVANQTNFALVFYFPEYGQTSTDVYVATTEVGCSSGFDVNLLYDGAWTPVAELFDGFDVDLFLFPIVEGDVTGLTDAELASLTYVYPNPAKSEVMLASSFGLQRVEIVNVLGQVVYGAEVSGNSVKVATSDFAAGNYIVKMYTEGGVVAKKLVVE